MSDLLLEFKGETKELLEHLEKDLEILEEDPTKGHRFEHFGQIIDRIAGGAKSLALLGENVEALTVIGDYAEVCKAVGYKMSQTQNPALANVVVAFFADALEGIDAQLGKMGNQGIASQAVEDHKNLLDRLKWLVGKFDPSLRSSVGIESKYDETKDIHQQILTILTGFNPKK